MSTQAPFLRFSYTRGLCDWCAPPGGVCRCCYVCWCFPCAFGNLAERLGPNEIICGQNWCGGCLLAWLSSYVGAPCLVMSPARLSVRNKYGIKGDTCEDIICGWCCAPCLLCQLLNEVDINTARGVGTEFGPPPGLPPPAVYIVAVPGQAVGTMPAYVPPQPELPPQQHQHQRQQQRHGYVKMG